MSIYAATTCGWFLLSLAPPSSSATTSELPPLPTVPVVDDARRAALLYEEAREHYQEGRLREAAVRAVDAYRLLDLERKYGKEGLAVLKDATKYHLEVYDETHDPIQLARIQMELEDFIEHHRSDDSSRVDELRRRLHTVRNERLEVARRLAEQGEHLRAAKEAGACFSLLGAGDKGEAIGRRTAIAASVAYRAAWNLDKDVNHLKRARHLMDQHLEHAGDRATRAAIQERHRVNADLGLAQVMGGAFDPGDSAPPITITRRDRGFFFASGAALGGSTVLTVGAALWGSTSYLSRDPPGVGGDMYVVEGQARTIAPAAVLSVAAGTTAGLAIHGMIDSGYVPARERRIVAASCTAFALAGLATSLAIVATGLRGFSFEGNEATRRRRLANGGLGLMMGMGAPLGAGISALISRHGGAR